MNSIYAGMNYVKRTFNYIAYNTSENHGPNVSHSKSSLASQQSDDIENGKQNALIAPGVGSNKSKKKKLNNGQIVGGEYEYIPNINSSNFQIHSN